MVIKMIIFMLALYLGYRLVKVLVRKKLQSLFGVPKEEKKIQEDRLVQCVTCQTWVSEKKSLSKGGKSYCSSACLKI